MSKYKYKKNYGYKKRNRKRKSKYHELERAAYKHGQIERGMANPNSRIFQAYQAGLAVPSKKEKKPLF